jgi:hypothetical protein
MYKTLCVAALLIGLLALTGRSSSASPAPFTSPVIVARGKLLNQTGTLSNPIFTPSQSGLYRLSVYATVTTADPNSTSNWYYGFSWTDVTGATRGVTLLVADNRNIGEFFNAALWYEFGDEWADGGVSRTIQVNANTPITQDVSLNNGPPDNSAYSLYYTLERLE